MAVYDSSRLLHKPHKKSINVVTGSIFQAYTSNAIETSFKLVLHGTRQTTTENLR